MLGLISKKRLVKEMKELKARNKMQENKKTNPGSAQWAQGYEDGNANCANYVIYLCK
jgi:hypothetical protein